MDHEQHCTYRPPWAFGSQCIGGDRPYTQVLTVSNLGDQEAMPGTLRNALAKANGPTIIRFECEGRIDLRRQLHISGAEYLSILGPTTGAGVTIARRPMLIDGSSHVEVCNLRFRLGNQAGPSDCLTVIHSDNVLIDKCSFAWSVDECVSLTHCTRSSLQRSIIAWPLDRSVHPKGPHGLAGLYVGEVSLVGNLFCHAQYRPDVSGRIQIVDNAFYNYGDSYPVIVKKRPDYSGPNIVDVLGNSFVPGPSTAKWRAIHTKDPEARIYVDRNTLHPHLIVPTSHKASPHPAFANYGHSRQSFRSDVGPTVPDNLDRLAKHTAEEGKGRIIDRPEDLGGWDWLDRMTLA